MPSSRNRTAALTVTSAGLISMSTRPPPPSLRGEASWQCAKQQPAGAAAAPPAAGAARAAEGARMAMLRIAGRLRRRILPLRREVRWPAAVVRELDHPRPPPSGGEVLGWSVSFVVFPANVSFSPDRF